MDDPRLPGFVKRLDGVNALADAAPGFVWRLQAEGGDATTIPVFDDAYTVAWWVPAGYRPTVQDAEQRLLLLRTIGPGPESFSLSRPYPPPGQD